MNVSHLAVPTIELTPDLADVVDLACKALANHPEIYQREGRLVQTIKIASRVTWAREGESGVPVLREVPIATLACELTRCALWTKFDGRAKRSVECEPPERVVAAVAAAARWPGMRTLHGIVEAPLMRADGSILQTPGYDAATGVIFEPGGTVYPPVPEAPTLEDARRALADLLEPFEEFPFATDADRLVPIAIALTSLAMGALEGANFPCFLLDANVQGTGKTLCADAIAWILTGREVPKQTFPSDDKNELEKILGGAARAATPMLCLDNINGVFGGDALEQRMTCRGSSQFRILGKSKNESLPWRCIVLASGNNVRTTVDMRRRIIRCRLVAKQENPEERPIKRSNLRGWILERRPQLVAAGLTILRAYVLAGRPKQETRAMGNFEEWVGLIASALKWTSGVDVVEAKLPDAVAFDPVTEAYGEFLATFEEPDPAFARPWVLGRDYLAKEFARMSCWDELVPPEDKNRTLRVSGVIREMTERPSVGDRSCSACPTSTASRSLPCGCNSSLLACGGCRGCRGIYLLSFPKMPMTYTE